MADSAYSRKKEKILIIEGNLALGEEISSVLRTDGYLNVYLVKDGAEGLKSIYDILPHIILMNINLPGTDGYEILATKHAEPLLTKIPVFLMSTQGVPVNMRNIPQGSISEFIVSLHISAADILDKINRHFGYQPVAFPTEESTSKVGKIKLLWVEDDKLIGTILSKKLVSSGFDLFHAKNAEQALNYLKADKPDVIVVDLLLPGMSGFDILEEINKDDKLKDVPRMVLSNLSKSSDIEKARVLGAGKFLVKASTSLAQIVEEIRGMYNK